MGMSSIYVPFFYEKFAQIYTLSAVTIYYLLNRSYLPFSGGKRHLTESNNIIYI